MRLRIDTFTWIVIGAVLLLVVAAVVTVNLTGGEPETPATYRSDDSPATPVYNALVAVQQGDIARARAQFTDEALDQYGDSGYDPVANAVNNYLNDQSGRRTRIIEVSDPTGDEASVTIAEDNFGGGGLFGRSTYTNQRIVRVVREDGVWKIAENNLFY
jgi:hypothetical protein